MLAWIRVVVPPDLITKLEAEAAAHKAARERAEKAESQVSMATLDLKTTREEARQKQQEVTSLQTKVHRRLKLVYCV